MRKQREKNHEKFDKKQQKNKSGELEKSKVQDLREKLESEGG